MPKRPSQKKAQTQETISQIKFKNECIFDQDDKPLRFTADTFLRMYKIDSGFTFFSHEDSLIIDPFEPNIVATAFQLEVVEARQDIVLVAVPESFPSPYAEVFIPTEFCRLQVVAGLSKMFVTLTSTQCIENYKWRVMAPRIVTYSKEDPINRLQKLVFK